MDRGRTGLDQVRRWKVSGGFSPSGEGRLLGKNSHKSPFRFGPEGTRISRGQQISVGSAPRGGKIFNLNPSSGEGAQHFRGTQFFSPKNGAYNKMTERLLHKAGIAADPPPPAFCARRRIIPQHPNHSLAGEFSTKHTGASFLERGFEQKHAGPPL